MTHGPVASPSLTGLILLAEPDPAVRGWIQPVLTRKFGDRVRHLASAPALEERLLADDSVSLVVSNARLEDYSSLRSLARVRSFGSSVPWIVYTAFEENLMRILLSDVDGTVLSSRVVDLDNLAELGSRLVRRAIDRSADPH